MHTANWPEIIVVFAIVLGIMVLVHEFGHFIVAKAFGVRVEAFAVGFGPRLFGYVYKGTDYRLNLLPLGGYVKMAGEYTGTGRASTTESELVWSPDADRSDFGGAPDEFPSKPRWQRVCIALAGPMMNFILAIGLLGCVYMRHHPVDEYRTGPAVVDYVPSSSPAAHAGIVAGDTVAAIGDKQNPTWDTVLEEVGLHGNSELPLQISHQGEVRSVTLNTHATSRSNDLEQDPLTEIGLIPKMQSTPVTVASLQGGMPAERAGVRPGDQIVSIDGVQMHSVQALLAYLSDRNGAPDTLQLLRNGQTLSVPITPERVGSGSDAAYHLGFSPVPPPTYVERLSLPDAFAESWRDNVHSSTLIVRVLKGMFTRQVSVRSLSGPVGMAQQIGFALNEGLWAVLELMCVISINLGIFNLLPIPILDGGLILFLVIEGAMRRDLSMEVKERVYQVAFVCLILFAAFVMFNDLTKLHHS